MLLSASTYITELVAQSPCAAPPTTAAAVGYLLVSTWFKSSNRRRSRPCRRAGRLQLAGSPAAPSPARRPPPDDLQDLLELPAACCEFAKALPTSARSPRPVNAPVEDVAVEAYDLLAVDEQVYDLQGVGGETTDPQRDPRRSRPS